MAYEPVTPKDHDAACRRGQSGWSGFDPDNCERCRNLDAALDNTPSARARHSAAEDAAAVADPNPIKPGRALKAELHTIDVAVRLQMLDWMADHRPAYLRTVLRESGARDKAARDAG